MNTRELVDIIEKDIDKCVKIIEKNLKRNYDEKSYGHKTLGLRQFYRDVLYETIESLSIKPYTKLYELVFSFDKRVVERAYNECSGQGHSLTNFLFKMYKYIIYYEVDKLFRITSNGNYILNRF